MGVKAASASSLCADANLETEDNLLTVFFLLFPTLITGFNETSFSLPLSSCGFICMVLVYTGSTFLMILLSPHQRIHQSALPISPRQNSDKRATSNNSKTTML